MSDKMPPGYLSVEQASKQLLVGEWAIKAAIKRGEIKAVKRFRRWYIDQASVEGLLKVDERAA